MEQVVENNNLDKIVGENINFLRTQNKITQLELAEKINYSDKVVSKWERGESIPAIDVLLKLAEIFHVDLNFFVVKHSKDELTKKQNNIVINKKTITIFSVCALWAIMAIVFVSLYAGLHEFVWQVLMWTVPLTFVALIVFTCVWHKQKFLKTFCSLLNWSFFISLYCQFLSINPNLWIVFLIAIPVQIAILFLDKIKKDLFKQKKI